MPLTEHRKMTHEEFMAEAVRRFGPDPLAFAFVCPTCGDRAAIGDFPPHMRGRAGQECLGRVLAEVSTDTEWAGRGCMYVAYGLIPGPWEIEMPDGRTIRSFPFGEAE